MYQRGAGWGAEPCLRCALGNIVKSGRRGYYWTTVEYWRVGPAPQQPAWPEAGQKRCPKPAAVAGRGRPVLAPQRRQPRMHTTACLLRQALTKASQDT